MRYQELENGFTLIELLVVIAIISVISMFAIPSFKKQIVEKQIQNEVHIVMTCFKDSQIQAITLRRNVTVKLNNGGNELICGEGASIPLNENINIGIGSGLDSSIVFTPEKTVLAVPDKSSSGNLVNDPNGGFQFCFEGYPMNQLLLILGPQGQMRTAEGAACKN